MAPADPTRFLAADTKSTSLHVEDTGDRLTARPLGYPMGWVWPFLALPFAGIAGAFAYLLATGRLDWTGWLPFGLAVALGPALVRVVLALVRAENDRQTAPGPFLTLDRVARTLALPRLGRTLAADDVLGFVQVHGFHTTVYRGFLYYESHSDWTAELSVLTPDGAGGVERLPVVTAMRTDRVDRLGRLLAEFFDRPRQVIRPRLWSAVLGTFRNAAF